MCLGQELVFENVQADLPNTVNIQKNESKTAAVWPFFFFFKKLEMWSLWIKKVVKVGAQLAASFEGRIYIPFNMNELILALRQSSVFWGQQRWSDDWLINVLFAFFCGNTQGFRLSVDCAPPARLLLVFFQDVKLLQDKRVGITTQLLFVIRLLNCRELRKSLPMCWLAHEHRHFQTQIETR